MFVDLDIEGESSGPAGRPSRVEEREGCLSKSMSDMVIACLELPHAYNLGPKHCVAAQVLVMNYTAGRRTTVKMLVERLNVADRTVRRVIADLRAVGLVVSARGMRDISGLIDWVNRLP